MSPLQRKGEVFTEGAAPNERHFVRIRITADERPKLRLWGAKSREHAEELATWIATFVDELVTGDRPDIARKALAQAARATTPKARKRVDELVAGVLDGTRYRRGEAVMVDTFAGRWMSGELHKAYPDYIKKKDSSDDRSRWKNYVSPIVGDVFLPDFRLEHGEKVMASLPEWMSPANRRHVAQVLRRVLELAVFPCKLIPHNPLPVGFLPKLGPKIAKVFLYPDEDAKLLRSADLGEQLRLAFGVLAREGMRAEELVGSDWADWDERGFFTLDENKTFDPRFWAVRPDVASAMRIWRKKHPELAKPFDGVPLQHLARELRKSLKVAGVTRSELFKTTEARRQMRAHDLRATFVTLSLAAGKTDTWISDRTGHKSSAMIANYRRPARSAAELGLGELGDLVELLGWAEPHGPHVPPCEAFAGSDGCKCRRLAIERIAAAIELECDHVEELIARRGEGWEGTGERDPKPENAPHPYRAPEPPRQGPEPAGPNPYAPPVDPDALPSGPPLTPYQEAPASAIAERVTGIFPDPRNPIWGGENGRADTPKDSNPTPSSASRDISQTGSPTGASFRGVPFPSGDVTLQARESEEGKLRGEDRIRTDVERICNPAFRFGGSRDVANASGSSTSRSNPSPRIARRRPRGTDDPVEIASERSLTKDIKRPRLGPGPCAGCLQPATCAGEYEGAGLARACDACCGHGNEDGWCEPIDPSIGAPVVVGSCMRCAEPFGAGGDADCCCDNQTLERDVDGRLVREHVDGLCRRCCGCPGAVRRQLAAKTSEGDPAGLPPPSSSGPPRSIEAWSGRRRGRTFAAAVHVFEGMCAARGIEVVDG